MDPIFKSPTACNNDELAAFEELVRQGGEVTPAGLENRIKAAHLLGFAYLGSELFGVGGLKKPEHSHRHFLEEKTGVSLPFEKFPFEIGWLYVKPTARGNMLGRRLLDGLLRLAEQRGIFCTSRLDDDHKRTHESLKRRGFAHVGRPFPSQDGKTKILLFARDPRS